MSPQANRLGARARQSDCERIRERAAHCFHPLLDALTDADGAMLEPLGVAIHAVDLGHVRPGMTVGDRGSAHAP